MQGKISAERHCFFQSVIRRRIVRGSDPTGFDRLFTVIQGEYSMRAITRGYASLESMFSSRSISVSNDGRIRSQVRHAVPPANVRFVISSTRSDVYPSLSHPQPHRLTLVVCGARHMYDINYSACRRKAFEKSKARMTR